MADGTTGVLQEFLAGMTEKGVGNIEEALLRIPEDKRTWSPEGKGRSALNQVAEIALLNGTTAGIIATGAWPADYSFEQYFKDQVELAQSTEGALAKLKETLPLSLAAIRGVADEDLTKEVTMPWGPMKMSEIIAYPHWNMSYHEGQINYIASMLGCLP